MDNLRTAHAGDYEKICAELGFCPETHFVEITTRGTISFSAGKPDEIRALYAACLRHGYKPSRALANAAGL